MHTISIDIIVPTYRLQENLLLGIIQLPKPENVSIHFFIVVDQPGISIPPDLQTLNSSGEIRIIIHDKNKGPGAARNTAMRAGSSKWILFLDDDVVPRHDLLTVYANAILKNENALGFAGVTNFPEPFNAATRALQIGGWTHHSVAARNFPALAWAPTSNMLLNREKTDSALFDESLVKSGEDIDFLVRNSLLFKEMYVSLPAAIVSHPWWNQGSVQTKRMFRYGEGAGQIAARFPIREYSFRDFTNTIETLFLLLILLPFGILFGFAKWIVVGVIIIMFAEFLTNWVKAIVVSHTIAPLVAFQLMWAKNSYETGRLFNILQSGKIGDFAKRIDMGFSKKNPPSFRTNRWKILKMILITVLFVIYFVAF